MKTSIFTQNDSWRVGATTHGGYFSALDYRLGGQWQRIWVTEGENPVAVEKLGLAEPFAQGTWLSAGPFGRSTNEDGDPGICLPDGTFFVPDDAAVKESLLLHGPFCREEWLANVSADELRLIYDSGKHPETFGPGKRYPYPFDIDTRVVLEGPEAVFTTQVRNRSKARAALSHGWHNMWVRSILGLEETPILTMPASLHYPQNDKKFLLPLEKPVPVEGSADFRNGKELVFDFDDGFELDGDTDQEVVLRLTNPESKVEVTARLTGYSHVVVFTPNDDFGGGIFKDTMGVEFGSGAPNAALLEKLGVERHGLKYVEPEEASESSFRLTVEEL